MMEKEIENLCKDVVSYKEFLDKLILLRDSLGFFNRTWLKMIGLYEKKNTNFPSIFPAVFAETIFPFSYLNYSDDSNQLMELDPNLVIGGRYNSYEHEIYNEQYVIEKLNGITEKGKNHFEAARYCKIGNFPIYVAIEGKNRVSLFKNHEKSIKAWVTNVVYPLKEDLVIKKTKPFGVHYLESKSKKKSKIVLFPFLTLSILEQYGVKTEDGGFNFRSLFELRKAFSCLTSKQMRW